jgi:hypothetical protein
MADRANPGCGADLSLLADPSRSATVTPLWTNPASAGWSASQVGRPSALIPR